MSKDAPLKDATPPKDTKPPPDTKPPTDGISSCPIAGKTFVHDGVTKPAPGPGPIYSWAHKVTKQGMVLTVFLAFSGPLQPKAVTYGGVQLPVCSHSTGAATTAMICYTSSPPPCGTATVVVEWAGATPVFVAAWATAWEGAKPGLWMPGTSFGSGTSAGIAITTPAPANVIDLVCVSNTQSLAPVLSTPPQTLIDQEYGAGYGAALSTRVSTPTATAMIWSIGVGPLPALPNWAQVGLAVPLP